MQAQHTRHHSMEDLTRPEPEQGATNRSSTAFERDTDGHKVIDIRAAGSHTPTDDRLIACDLYLRGSPDTRSRSTDVIWHV